MRTTKTGLCRDGWKQRATEFVKRGEELSHTKLTTVDVQAIRSAQRQRESLLQHIKNNLSNEALSKRLGVSKRTLERITANETWSHVA